MPATGDGSPRKHARRVVQIGQGLKLAWHLIPHLIPLIPRHLPSWGGSGRGAWRGAFSTCVAPYLVKAHAALCLPKRWRLLG